MPQADVAAFRLTPDLRFLFVSDASETAFAALCQGIRRGDRLLLLTGPFGVGKSLLLRRIESHLAGEGVPAAYAAYATLHLDELLAWCHAGAPAGTPAPRSCVVLLDDADRCPDALLGELQARIAAAPADLGVQLVLAGSPLLAERLAAEFPQLLQLARVHAQLAPLGSDEAGAYIRHRLDVSGKPQIALAGEAARDVFHYSQGIPRLINHACARALLLAGPELSVVSQQIAREAIEDYVANTAFGQTAVAQFAPPPPEPAVADVAVPVPPLAERPPEASIQTSSTPDEAATPSAAVPNAPAPEALEAAPAATLIESEITIPAAPAPSSPRPVPEPPAGSRALRPNQRLRLLTRQSGATTHDSPLRPAKFSGFRPRRAAAPASREHAPAELAQRPGGKLGWRLVMIAIVGAALAAAIVGSHPQWLDAAVVIELRAAMDDALARAYDAIREAAIVMRRKVDDLI
jgi:type II secretory pathway predicted ATPase ExeA